VIVQEEHKALRQLRVRLRGLENGAGDKSRELTRAVTVFGSGDGCDVILPPDKVDIAHAAVTLLGNTAYLCDLGASGGTSLNGRRIRWARLADGDELAVNTCRFRVELEEDSTALTGEQPSFRLRDDTSIGDVMTIDPVLIVGSDPGCDVVLHDEAVAARHCLVIWTQEGPLLRDLQEGERLRLNGKPVRSAHLVSGDRIAIGPYEMSFEIEAASPNFGRTVRPDYPDNVRLQSGETVLYRGEESRAPTLISGRLAAGDGSDLELLWPGSAAMTPEEMDEPELLLLHDKDEDALESSNSDQAATAESSTDQDSDALELLNSEDECETAETEEDRQSAETVNDQPPAEAAAPLTERGESVEVGSDIPETNEEEGLTVDSNFAMEDERMESAELTHGASSTEQQDQMETRTDDEQNSSRRDDLARVRSRVAAAQQALDQRALKHLEQLNAERLRLRAYQSELQQKASELLKVARENRRLLNRDGVTGEPGVIGAKASEELTLLGRLAGELQTIEATHATSAQSYQGEDDGILGEALSGMGRRSLQERAAELAELVRSEQDEIDRAESQFASLRLGINRMRDFVERTGIRQRAQASELEMLQGTLRREEVSLARERELLMAKLQELDGRIAKVGARIEDAGREREDLDREGERLAQVQKKLVEKEETLRSGLDLERQRIQVRQSELQRKAAELARAARDKRCAVEAEMSKRRAALDLQEAELRAHRAAVEEAGRNELEKAATELERVLSVRLADIEAEISVKQGGNGTAGQQSAASKEKDTAERADVGDRKGTLFADKPLSESAAMASMLREAADGRGRRLTALQEELAALRDAMTKLGKQNDEHEASIEDEMRTLRTSQSAARRDRRWSVMELRGQDDRSNATLRGAENKSDDRTASGSEVAAAASGSGGPHGGEGRSDGR
jgi:pSer/pThr/pTyr-binding forkhead associated (FHA) protein